MTVWSFACAWASGCALGCAAAAWLLARRRFGPPPPDLVAPLYLLGSLGVLASLLAAVLAWL